MKHSTRWLIWSAASWLLLWGSRCLPLQPVHTIWSQEETYTQGRVPAYPAIKIERCARSVEGLVIGRDGPGALNLKFSIPGPFPTSIQPEWLPGPEPAQILLIILSTPVPQAVVLSKNLPLRYRAIDFSRYLRGHPAFVLRFEGRQALLKGLKLHQTDDASIPLWPFILVLLGVLGCLPKQRPLQILWLIVVVGFILRWFELRNYFSIPLQDDALGFWELSKSLSWMHPWQTAFREPLFIWLVKVAQIFLGDSGRVLRFISLCFSLGCIGMSYRVALAFSGSQRLALLAAGLYALNPFALFMSSQGLQLEFYTFLILVLLLLWRLNKPLPIAIAGALLCLTRTQFVFSVVPLILLGAWRYRWKKKDILSSLLVFLILIAPYYGAVKARTGSYLGHLNQHAAAYQAGEKLGDILRKNELPSVTAWQLLFSNHSIPSLLLKTSQGYASMFLNPTSPYNHLFLNAHYDRPWNWLFFPFFWLGVGTGFRRGEEGRWVLLMIVLFLNVLPLFYDVFREPRLVFHVAPLVAILTATGMDRAWLKLESFSRRGRR